MPKVHYVDTGLACHLLGLRSEGQLLGSQYYGGLLGNLVYMECCKQASWGQEEVGMYHFRDRNQHEVDIVLERANGNIIGVEVKASASVNPQDFRACQSWQNFLARHLSKVFCFIPVRRYCLLNMANLLSMRCQLVCSWGLRVSPGRCRSMAALDVFVVNWLPLVVILH